jgi:DNA polymerase IV (archaeal DinB-like DNA polymerase)
MTEEQGKPRIILHLDMDSFYASVEMQARPDIRNKPVVIGADPKHGRGRGVVSTCSYEARAFGIRSAMPISRAFALCPQAVYLPPDFLRYARVSAEVMEILRSTGFCFEQVSIDEAFLDISPLGNFPAAGLFAEQVQSAIRTGLGLSCSIGIAPCKLVAKIASDFRKPRGITIVEPAQTQGFLAPMPARKIPGIGGKTDLVLLELGIRTIGDLAACDCRKLAAVFGRSAAGLQEAARGIDRTPVEDRKGVQSISRETTFETDTDDPALLAATLHTLAGEVHTSLAAEHLRFRTMTIKVRYHGFITRTKASTLSRFTDDMAVIHSCAESLLRELISDRKIRLLGIRLSSLEKEDVRQCTLDC